MQLHSKYSASKKEKSFWNQQTKNTSRSALTGPRTSKFLVRHLWPFDFWRMGGLYEIWPESIQLYSKVRGSRRGLQYRLFQVLAISSCGWLAFSLRLLLPPDSAMVPLQT